SQSSYSDRIIDESLLFLPLNFSPKEIKTLYIHYRILGDAPISLRVFSENKFKKYQFLNNSLNSSVLGFMSAVLILVVIFLVLNPSISYFYFACLILAMSFVIADMAGYNHKYFWPENGTNAEKYIEYIMVLTHLFYLLFIREVMHLKTLNSTLYQIYSGLILIALLMLSISTLYNVFEPLLIIGTLLVPVFIYTSIWGLRNKLTSARIFALSIISHTFFVFGLFMFSMLVTNPFPSISLFSYVSIGYVLEAIFFTMTLSHRNYTTKKRYQDSLLSRINEANEQLLTEQKNNQLLKEKQEQLLKFTGTVHDLFQPLSSVRMAAGVIPEESGKDIKNHIDNTVGYAESLLKSFMLESKGDFQSLNRGLVLGDVFESVTLRHQSSANEKNLKIKFFNSHITCEAYQENLVRILDNLMTNAIRYTHSGGVLIGSRYNSKGVEIQVIDTGIGMSLLESQKLLKPFEQSKTGKQGYGIGLYVVKKLCEQSGFELSVSSVINQGTRFKILIPR
ncbi:MAG: sensor histidine kinase, partial [Bermanella sp.]